MAKANANIGKSYELLSVLANNADWDSLNPEDMQKMIDAPMETGAKFTAFIKNSGRMTVGPAPKIKARWVLKIGGKSIETIRTGLKAKGFKIGTYADQILGKMTVLDQEVEVGVADLTVAEIGRLTGRDFSKGAILKDIYAAIRELGELCHPSVGAALREEMKDQPLGEWVVIAMEPIKDSDGDLLVFSVVHDDGGQWLDGNDGYPDNFWYPDYRFAVVPRK